MTLMQRYLGVGAQIFTAIFNFTVFTVYVFSFEQKTVKMAVKKLCCKTLP